MESLTFSAAMWVFIEPSSLVALHRFLLLVKPSGMDLLNTSLAG